MNDPRHNPYRVSKAARKADGGAAPRSGLLIIATIEAVVGVMAAIAAPMVIGNFEELFKGFGADLPASTVFILASKYAWCLFAIAGIALLTWVLRHPAPTPVERRRQSRCAVAFAISFGAAWGFATVSLYLPIFRLGAVV